MSDSSQGPGWWIASDGKWYAPEQAADYVAPAPPDPDLPEPPTAETPVVPETPTAVAPVVPDPAATPPASSGYGQAPLVPGEAPPAYGAAPPSYGQAPPAYGQTPPPVVPGPAPPEFSQAPPPPAAKSGNGCLKAFLIVAGIMVVLGIGIVVVLAFVVNKAVDKASDNLDAQTKIEQQTGIKSFPLPFGFNSAHPPQKDISADDMTCSTDSSGDMQAKGTITNHSSKTSWYSITISFRQNGQELATASDLLPSVDAGSTADWVATSSQPVQGQFTCKIYEIDRFDFGTVAPTTTR